MNKNLELRVVFVSQPIVADRELCTDLLRRLPRDKTFRLSEKKRKATIPNPNGKSRVAKIGAHDMGLEQAGTLNITEITSGY